MLKPMHQETKANYAGDEKESVGLLIQSRLPWLIVGLIGGAFLTIFVSRFETTLSKDIHLAFFLPIIVYMSDAVGTQTETIFVRNLSKGKVHFLTYLVKELLLGLGIGLILGIILGSFTYLWLNDMKTAWTVGLAMFVNLTIAPIVALVVPEIFQLRHSDPAVGAGPFTTLIQDIISLIVYFTIATIILF